jgi:hypothetical protein
MSWWFDNRKRDPWAEAPPWALELRNMLSLFLRKENIIMSDLTDALDKAEANAKAESDAEDAVVALLTTLSAQIAALKAGGTDPATVARITALSDALKARATQLGAAVVANTPAA